MFDRGCPVDLLRAARPGLLARSTCAAASSDLHSGVFGGAVANPAFVLAQMIAQMKDRSGRIRIPGFYDDVRPMEEAERQAWAQLPFNEKKYRKDFGIPKLFGETGFTTLERTWARPTLEVNGLLVRLHRRRREDRAPGAGDGEDQHASRSRPGSRQDRGSVRGLRAEDHAEDGGAETHPHARRASRG